MKKIVLTFGLISGAVLSVMMLLTLPFMDRIGFSRAEVIGYATMVAAFLLVFFGVRAYRDQVEGGTLTFGRGFAVGLLITLIASVCYVATWEVISFRMTPGFADRYAAYAIERVKRSGASQQQIDATARQMETFKQMYNNPLTSAAMTFVEPLPVGILVSVISAVVLRKKRAA